MATTDAPVPGQRLYTPDQVAQLLGISRTKAWELTSSGQLRSTKIGKRRLVFANSVDEYVQQLEESA